MRLHRRYRHGVSNQIVKPEGYVTPVKFDRQPYRHVSITTHCYDTRCLPMIDDQDYLNLCSLPQTPDLSGVACVELRPQPPLDDYLEAMRLADAEAGRRFGDYMLLSWYDRDRDFESPQHASECHQNSAVPGYVDYGLHHGATLMVDIEQGRFVFFYLPVDF